MHNIHIAGTGIWFPDEKISNEELINSYNSYVDLFNYENHSKIQEGLLDSMEYSSIEFVEKASGIKSRSITPDAKFDVVGVVSATKYFGDGSELTGITAGATLSASAGAQRLVVTSLTSGTMTAAGTNADLAYNTSTNTLSATNLSGALPATNLTGTIADARFPATLPAVSGANLTNLPASGDANDITACLFV